MNLDATSLITSMIVSSIGFVLLSYGRKMSRPPHGIAGLVLLVYPYFVENSIIMFAIAAVLLGALWFAVRLGW